MTKKISTIRVASIVTALIGLVIPTGWAARYELNATTGDDSTGKPYRSWKAIRAILRDGDSVILHTGNYGSIEEGIGPSNVFAQYVDISAAPGESPEFNTITFGANGSRYYGVDKRGSYNIYMRFTGIKVLDGLKVYGGKNLVFQDCDFQRIGPWTGSAENIEKVACQILWSSSIVVENSRITKTGIGIHLSGFNNTVRGTSIYDITHDGIRCVGLTDSLISNNTIRGLDDGVEDAEASWSRHCDAIHIFVGGAPTEDAIFPNTNLVFSGNVIYDIESHGVQFNNYRLFPNLRNANIVFENNIFGPTRDITFNNADPANGLVFRHNSFIKGNREYRSPYTETGRTILCGNGMLRISNETKAFQCYNNILGTVSLTTSNAAFFNFNAILSPELKTAYPRHTLLIEQDPYLDAFNFDGLILPTSITINRGTLRPGDYSVPRDIKGTPRDLRPDLGAVEFPGLSPAAEKQLPAITVGANTFVDDFEDANLSLDPELNTEGVSPLSWSHTSNSTSQFTLRRSLATRNVLSSPSIGGTSSLLVSREGSNWSKYTFSFTADNQYILSECGPTVLVRDEGTYYFVDIGRDTGILYRVINGLRVAVASNPILRMPNSGQKRYTIRVDRVASRVSIEVDVGDDGVSDFTYKETDQTANTAFTAGNIGFFYAYSRDSYTISFDDIKVSLEPPVAPQVPTGLRRVVYP